VQRHKLERGDFLLHFTTQVASGLSYPLLEQGQGRAVGTARTAVAAAGRHLLRAGQEGGLVYSRPFRILVEYPPYLSPTYILPTTTPRSRFSRSAPG